MSDETFTISKNDLIDILTKSGVFNAEGIEIVLSRSDLKGVLMGMMCTIDDFHLRANHYKEECSRLRGQIRDLESFIYKYEDMSKNESDR